MGELRPLVVEIFRTPADAPAARAALRGSGLPEDALARVAATAGGADPRDGLDRGRIASVLQARGAMLSPPG